MFPELPEIFVPTSEKRHLFAAANDASSGKLSIATFLRAELRRAHFCASTAFPSDTVNMNGYLTYRIDWGPESRPCRIVYPKEFSGSDNEISLFSPLGVALLGFHIGDRVTFFTTAHGFRLVSVVSVGQPDAIEPVPNKPDRQTQVAL